MTDHDCDWLGCTLLSCGQARNRASESSLFAHNIHRDGSPLGLPGCGDSPSTYLPGYSPWTKCRKAKGHAGRHAYGVVEWGEYVALSREPVRTEGRGSHA